MAADPALLVAMEETRQRIPDVLRALMAAKRRTGPEVAAAIGMSSSSFYARLNGKSAISVAELAALAAYFEVDVDVFFSPPEWLRSRWDDILLQATA